MHNTIKSLIFFVVVSLLAVTTANAGLTDNLEMYNSMDNITSTLLPDESGSSTTYDGTLTGTTVINDATRGSVLGISSASDYADYGNVLDPGTGDYTIALWLNSASNSNTAMLIGKGNKGSTDLGWNLFIQAETIILRACPPLGNPIDYGKRLGVSHDIDANTWYHVAMVFDRNDNLLKGYLNGSDSGWSIGGGGGATNVIDPGASISSSNTTLQLNPSTANDGRNFSGMLDDIAVWSRALSSTEIADIAGGTPIIASEVPEPGTIALLVSMLIAGLFVWRKR